MDGRLHTTAETLRSPIPWVVLSAAIALTVATWFAVERGRRDEARKQFERHTETAAAAVRARILSYEQVLRSGAARMASDQQVGGDDWRRFIAMLQIEQRFPGIRAVGYAEPPAAGGDRGGPVVVLHVEPEAGRQAFPPGEDLAADPVRRAALDKARESGEAAITGRVLLAGNGASGKTPGILMFVPIVRPEPRARPAVSGYVFGALRMHELLQGILDEGVLQVIDMRVYDQPEGRATQTQLVDTRAAPRRRAPAFERVSHFPMPGRSWTIHFVSRPGFDAALRAERPWILLAGGTLGSAVVFLLTTALVAAWNRAHHLSMRDPLTGLYNRRYLDETMPRELARAKREGQGVGLIALDIDHFKQLNDTHGHDAGDLVLQRMGELLRAATRGGDIACRMGGEEFAVILPGATPEAVRYRAESIRTAFSELRVDCDGRPVGPLTLSAGVSSVMPAGQDWAYVLRQADRALYAAKQAGRNRVLSSAEV
jgi:diguanylate cyclase